MYRDVLSNLIITKIHSVSTIYTEKNTRAERVSRPCWGIIIKFEGETRYENGGKTFVSNRNNMVILPKGSSYSWCCTKSGHYSVIEFDSDLEYDSILGFSVKNTDKILEIFKELEYKRTVKKPM